METFLQGLYIMLMCATMGTMFSMVSRSRNRDNMWYHVTCSAIAQTVYLLVLKELIQSGVQPVIMPFYIAGMAFGSVAGAQVSMFIEKRIFASADGHLQE